MRPAHGDREVIPAGVVTAVGAGAAMLVVGAPGGGILLALRHPDRQH